MIIMGNNQKKINLLNFGSNNVMENSEEDLEDLDEDQIMKILKD